VCDEACTRTEVGTMTITGSEFRYFQSFQHNVSLPKSFSFTRTSSGWLLYTKKNVSIEENYYPVGKADVNIWARINKDNRKKMDYVVELYEANTSKQIQSKWYTMEKKIEAACEKKSYSAFVCSAFHFTYGGKRSKVRPFFLREKITKSDNSISIRMNN